MSIGRIVILCLAVLGISTSLARGQIVIMCPPHPTNIVVNDRQCGQMLITWNQVIPGATYTVHRSVNSLFATAAPLAAGIAGTSYVDASAEAMQRYFYWVTTDTTFNCVPSNVVPDVGVSGMIFSQVPEAPKAPMVEYTCGQARILWIPSARAEVYRILRTINGIPAAQIVTSVTTTFADLHAAGGELWVIAENTCGKSAPVYVGQVAINGTTPQPVANVTIGYRCGSLDLSWEPTTGARWYEVSNNIGLKIMTRETRFQTPNFTNVSTRLSWTVRAANECGPSAPYTFLEDNWSGGFELTGPSGAVARNGTIAIRALGGGAGILASQINYMWFKDGAVIVDGGRVSGATTSTLTIANATARDAGDYVVVVQVKNGAGSVLCDWNRQTTVKVLDTCRTDFDYSGDVTITDIFSYLNAWFNGCP